MFQLFTTGLLEFKTVELGLSTDVHYIKPTKFDDKADGVHIHIRAQQFLKWYVTPTGQPPHEVSVTFLLWGAFQIALNLPILGKTHMFVNAGRELWTEVSDYTLFKDTKTKSQIDMEVH